MGQNQSDGWVLVLLSPKHRGFAKYKRNLLRQISTNDDNFITRPTPHPFYICHRFW